MRKSPLLYIIFLLLGLSLFGQGTITLKTPQSAGTQIACQIINLQPGFSFAATSGKSLTLKADPSVCNPYGGTTDGFSSNQNYILTRTYTTADGSRYLDQVQYFDGLGRPVQTVQRGITPSAADLVTLQEYDTFGRESSSWLPAVIPGNNGAYVLPAKISAQAVSGHAGDQKPYSMPVYEASPLNRVLKQYGPGQDWHNNGKALETDYKTNSTTDAKLNCKLYKTGGTKQAPTLTQAGNYATGELYVTEIKDENGNTTYEFKDKLGQVVLTRQINNNINHDTYYVYNDFGLQCFVLPPRIQDEGITQAKLDELAYLYKYDNRNRCIAKKLPGCDWIYYVYDKADRLIFTQDGEQRKDGKNEWTFSIPDAFGRILMTGICKNVLNYAADPLKDVVVVGTYNPNATTLPASCTVSGIALNTPVIYSANFYDGYSFLSIGGFSALTYDDTKEREGYGKRYTNSSKTLLTGSVSAIFDGSANPAYLYSALYYDDKKQLVQAQSTNHLKGKETEYIAYNFTGQPIKKLHIHTKDAQGGGKQTETYTYTYDHAGRLLTTTHQLTDGTTVKPQVTLAENSYDELGRLKTNKKGGRAELNTTFTYNVRSWTKSINSPLFSQTLFYNDKVTAHTYPDYQPAYNGNISGMEWQVKDDIKRSYRFKYDNLSRLTHAGYNGVVSGGMYNSYYEYDKHGNITVLDRRGKKSLSETSNELVDQLRMTYNGNQLTKVSDAIPNFAFAQSADFKNYGGGNAAYTYNKNGAMESDLHKGITRIQYNSLNLPYELLIKNTEVSGKVYYTYSASGVKLKTRHMKSKNLGYSPVTGTAGDTNLDVVKTTDYVGNMVYENNALKRILVDGGYIENGVYYFYQTDHLGNNRVVANQGGTPIQKNHYYPFGMAFAEGTTQEQGKQPYKYNGKELDQLLGLNLYDYSARYMDAAIGRFTTVDPLAEKYYSWSPYAYVMNNPLMYTDPTGMYSTTEWMRDNGVTENDMVNVYTAPSGEKNEYVDDPPNNTNNEKKTNGLISFILWGLDGHQQVGKIINDGLGKTEATYEENLVLGLNIYISLWSMPTMAKAAAEFNSGSFRLPTNFFSKNQKVRKYTINPSKFDYFFGRVSSSTHNTARSAQNLKDLNTLGIFDETQLLKHFDKAYNSPTIRTIEMKPYGVGHVRSIEVGTKGKIDVTFFYNGGNTNLPPTITTIIPKIYKK